MGAKGPLKVPMGPEDHEAAEARIQGLAAQVPESARGRMRRWRERWRPERRDGHEKDDGTRCNRAGGARACRLLLGRGAYTAHARARAEPRERLARRASVLCR